VGFADIMVHALLGGGGGGVVSSRPRRRLHGRRMRRGVRLTRYLRPRPSVDSIIWLVNLYESQINLNGCELDYRLTLYIWILVFS
jgi:hypothetical protein